MSRLIMFVENYTAGGADGVARLLIENLHVEKLYLYINKRIDPSVLLNGSLPEYVETRVYNLLTIADMYRFALSLKKIYPLYILLKLFSYLVRYPLLCFSLIYFYVSFRKVKATHFLANNGGYPGGDYCRTATIAAGLLKKFKVFHVFHSIPRAPNPLLRPVEFYVDRVLDRGCTMLCVSRNTGSVLTKRRNFSQLPICIYNGIPATERKSYSKHSGLRLLHVGYFDAIKNQEMLIRCMRKLLDMGFHDIHLHLVGKENDHFTYRHVMGMVKSFGLGDYVFFEGFQEDIYPYYYENDILLLSSRAESFPMVILEAMSVGMPIISTRVGGIEEQVVDGVNGYLVESDDVASFVARILRFHKDLSMIREMGKASYSIFQRRFTLERMINRYQDILGLRSDILKN